MVVVENKGLTAIYYSILLAFLIAYATAVALCDMWASRIDMAAHIYPSLDVGDPDEGVLSSFWHQHINGQLCTASANEYRAGRRSYGNHTCTRPCRPGETPLHGCLSDRDAYTNEDASQVFLTTHMQEDIFHSNSVERRSVFLPAAEGLDVMLRYKYHEPEGRIFQASGEVRSSDTNVVTVLLRQDGTAMRKIVPGSQISLTVPQLLEMAGLQGELDAAQAGFAANLASGAAPIGRLTGLQLEVMLNCYGRLLMSSATTQPACYVRVVKSSEGWVSATQDLPGASGAVVRRELHGLRIRVRTGGYFTIFDATRTLQAVVVGLVILEIPAKLVLLFIMLCLGRLSSIYQDAIFRPFSLPQQVAGLSARLLTSAIAFERFGVDGRRATRERTLHKLFEAVRDHLPADGHAAASDDLLRFLDYSWETLAGTNEVSFAATESLEEEGVMGNISAKSITGSQNLRSLPASIALFDFASACNSVEPVAVETWLEFFRRGRTRSLFEKLFIPRDIQRHLKSMPGVDRPEYKVSQRASRSTSTNSLASGHGPLPTVVEETSAASPPRRASESEEHVLVQGVDPVDGDPEPRRSSADTRALTEGAETTDQQEGALRRQEKRDSSSSSARSTTTRGVSQAEMSSETFERLEDLNDRMNSLDNVRGSYVSLDRRMEQLDQSFLQQLGELEDRVNESLSKLDKRLLLLKDTIKLQIGPIDMASGGKASGQAAGGRIANLEADYQRQREEMDALKKRQNLIIQSIDSAERSISFLAATRSEAEKPKPPQSLSGLRASQGSPRPTQSPASSERTALQPRETTPGCSLPRGSLGKRDGSVFMTSNV